MPEDEDQREEPGSVGPFSPPENSPRDGRGEGSGLDTLPPPFFPPGSRRARRGPASTVPEVEEWDEADFPEDAFILPDDPFRKRAEAEVAQAKKAVVPEELEEWADHIAGRLEAAARELRSTREISLTTGPSKDPFERALRNFLGSYFYPEGQE